MPSKVIRPSFLRRRRSRSPAPSAGRSAPAAWRAMPPQRPPRKRLPWSGKCSGLRHRVDVPGTVPANNIIGCEAHSLSLLHASGVALDAWVLLTGSDAGKLSFKPLSNSSSLALSRRMPCLRSSAFLSGGAGSNFSVTQVSFRYLKRLELPTVPFEEQRSRGLLSNGKNQKAPAARALSFRLHLLL